VQKVRQTESELYFKQRPAGRRLGAWVSQQSSVVANREFLEEKFREMEKKYPGEDIPLPEYWGGYALTPLTVEFWQGRVNRLHDRFRYARQQDASWLIERLAP
jgi:pyridoxamine 5'-phosphate oxidase